LSDFQGRFVLSTWHHNDFRRNEYIESLWSPFHILTRDHFYHVGGKEKNRNPMVEALIANFPPSGVEIDPPEPEQLLLIAS
jgi:DNA adenine methylase